MTPDESRNKTDTPNYVIDSSSIIAGQKKLYPQRVFPTLWNKVEGLVKEGALYIPPQVVDEVTRKDDDDPNQWVRKVRENQFRPSADLSQDVEKEFRNLAEKWPSPRLLKGADLYVIAYAKLMEATVITEEKPNSKEAETLTKIPSVCERKKVKCINLLDLLEEQEWTFR